jgi:dihydroorotase
MDLIIEARAWIQGTLRDVEIGIEGGRIQAVKHDLPGSPRKRFRGQLLFPSGIDWHVHFRDPGAAQKEDFRSGTIGAALGGVGAVFDMPNTTPIVDRPSHLAEKADTIGQKACVDWGLWATVTPKTVQLETLLQKANGIKLFLSPTTGVEASLSDAQLVAAIEQAQAARRWVLVHAESTPGKRLAASTRDHDDNRPAAAEVDAIESLATMLQDRTGVHIAHATTAEALEAARVAGFNVGVTPHHLLLSYEQVSDTRGKVNPPLRSERERHALWEAFARGDDVQLESDHAPHTFQEKSERFHEAPSGMPGVETMLPLLLQLAKYGDVPIANVIAAACERPAARLGLDRGFLLPGQRADFFVVDPREPTKVRGDRLASRAGWTPFEGRSALVPTAHYLAGEVIVEDGEFVGTIGGGRRIQPCPRPLETEAAAATHHKP